MKAGRWIEGYYLATPLFVIGDWVFGANLRAVGLADWPLLRAGYYALIESISESGTGANPFTPEFLTNLLIASSAWCLTYFAGMPPQLTPFN